jgi:type I restriction enzyme S subunit
MENKLPEGWEWKKLGEIAEKIHYGYTASAVEKQIGPKLLRITDIQDNNVNWETVPFCEIAEKDKEKYLLREGDLVFARTGATVGKSYLLEGNVPDSVFASYLIRVILSDTVAKKYVYYFFQSSSYWLQIQSGKVGAGQPNVNATKLSEITLPIPPLETRQKIVAILEKAEETKKLRAQADELTQKLLQSVFLEMFGDFEKNPYNWKMTYLENICKKITDGTHQKPTYVDLGIRFLSVKNITQGYFDFSEVKYITQAEHKELIKRCKPEKNDILYTKVGVNYGIAEVVDVDEEFSIYVSLALLKPNFDIVNPYYLKFALNSHFVKEQANRRIKGIGVPDLHLIEIKKLKIPLPPLELQEKFEYFVKQFRTFNQNQQQSSLEINNLFDVLMQKAFTGELVS